MNATARLRGCQQGVLHEGEVNRLQKQVGRAPLPWLLAPLSSLLQCTAGCRTCTRLSVVHWPSTPLCLPHLTCTPPRPAPVPRSAPAGGWARMRRATTASRTSGKCATSVRAWTCSRGALGEVEAGSLMDMHGCAALTLRNGQQAIFRWAAGGLLLHGCPRRCRAHNLAALAETDLLCIASATLSWQDCGDCRGGGPPP